MLTLHIPEQKPAWEYRLKQGCPITRNNQCNYQICGIVAEPRFTTVTTTRPYFISV